MAVARINERLNLVIPLYDGDEPYAYVHSTPISREVFEANAMLLAKTFAAIHAEGLGEIAGPRVAALLMRDMGTKDRVDGLLNEVRRLSNVILLRDGAWVTLPYQEVFDRKSIDADDLAEVENSLIFFTTVCRMYPRQLRQGFLDGAARLWGAQMSSQNSTEYRNSLPILTEVVSTGAPATTSLLPS